MLLLFRKAKQTRRFAMKLLNEPKSKQEILERLRAVRPDSPRRWGRMNARRMVSHLSDSFLGAMGERPTQVAPGYLARKLIKWVALHMPLPWPTKGVPTRPEFDQELGGTPPSDFGEDLRSLQVLIERYTRAATRISVPAASHFSGNDRTRLDALGLSAHAPPPAAVRCLVACCEINSSPFVCAVR